jgi:hypothetical protein
VIAHIFLDKARLEPENEREAAILWWLAFAYKRVALVMSER